MYIIFEIILQVIFTSVFETLHGSTKKYEHSTTTHTLYMLVPLWYQKKNSPTSLFTLKQTTQQTGVLQCESYYYFQIIPYTKENLIMWRGSVFKNLKVNMTMNMLLVSTSANITSEPPSDTNSHL